MIKQAPPGIFKSMMAPGSRPELGHHGVTVLA
jgi:hypothetical protein